MPSRLDLRWHSGSAKPADIIPILCAAAGMNTPRGRGRRQASPLCVLSWWVASNQLPALLVRVPRLRFPLWGSRAAASSDRAFGVSRPAL